MEFGILRTAPFVRYGSCMSFRSRSSVLESSLFSYAAFHCPARGFFTLARGRNNASSSSSVSPRPSFNKKPSNDLKLSEDDDNDEDAFEVMFTMLEKDLNADDSSNDYHEDITEEDMEMLQDQLEYALGIGSEDDKRENDEEETSAGLKTWQLRRLALALKTGRRKIGIKTLALELCLDRAVVLQHLRDPPPSLLMMSAALPDEPEPEVAVDSHESNEVDELDVQDESNEVDEPIHAMRQQWSAQKRIKKVHLATLERVYRKSRRPTNAMISSIVLVTNLPRRRVVKWFEDKRSEEGVYTGRTSTTKISQLVSTSV